jgi:hypothetical protein
MYLHANALARHARLEADRWHARLWSRTTKPLGLCPPPGSSRASSSLRSATAAHGRCSVIPQPTTQRHPARAPAPVRTRPRTVAPFRRRGRHRHRRITRRGRHRRHRPSRSRLRASRRHRDGRSQFSCTTSSPKRRRPRPTPSSTSRPTCSKPRSATSTTLMGRRQPGIRSTNNRRLAGHVRALRCNLIWGLLGGPGLGQPQLSRRPRMNNAPRNYS